MLPTPDDELEVRHVQPYEAVKVDRCPGCDHEIAVGVGHEVVVPVADPDLRRHWHTPCWRNELRARERAAARRSGPPSSTRGRRRGPSGPAR